MSVHSARLTMKFGRRPVLLVVVGLALAAIALWMVFQRSLDGRPHLSPAVDQLSAPDSESIAGAVANGMTRQREAQRVPLAGGHDIVVVDRAQVPIPDASILVHNAPSRFVTNGEVIRRIEADNDGIARVPDDIEGPAIMTVVAPGFLSRSLPMSASEAVLDRACILELRVVDAEGAPVAGVPVAVSPGTLPQDWENLDIVSPMESAHAVFARKSSAVGTCSFDVMPQTGYWFSIGGDEYVQLAPQQESISLAPEASMSLDVVVGVALGVVFEADDALLESAEIESDDELVVGWSQGLVRSSMVAAAEYPDKWPLLCIGRRQSLNLTGHSARVRVVYGGESSELEVLFLPVSRMEVVPLRTGDAAKFGGLRVDVTSGDRVLSGVSLNLVSLGKSRGKRDGVRAGRRILSGRQYRVPAGQYRVTCATSVFGNEQIEAECEVSAGGMREVAIQTARELAMVDVRIVDERQLSPVYALLRIEKSPGETLLIRSSKPQSIQVLLPYETLKFEVTVYGRLPRTMTRSVVSTDEGMHLELPVGALR